MSARVVQILHIRVDACNRKYREFQDTKNNLNPQASSQAVL